MITNIHIRWKNYIERLIGPIGSVIFHIILIVLLIKFAVVGSTEVPQTVEVILMETTAEKLDEIDKQIEEELKEVEDIPEIVEAVTPPEVAVISEQVDMESVGDGGAGGGMGTGFGPGAGEGDFSGLDVRSDAQSLLVMRGLYQGRSAGGACCQPWEV